MTKNINSFNAGLDSHSILASKAYIELPYYNYYFYYCGTT